MIAIKSRNAISETRVSELEAEIGFRLPQDYRDFLLHSNGGEPESNWMPSSDAGVCVRAFYSLDTQDHDDIEWGRSTTGPFPPSLLPIAYEDGGNTFLLTAAGQVLYWDHELEPFQADPDAPDFGPATVLAQSFQEFLDALVPL